MQRIALFVFVLAGCGGVEPARGPYPSPHEGDGSAAEPLRVGSKHHPTLAYLSPQQGPSVTVALQGGKCPGGGQPLAKTRTLVFPQGATDRAISSTAKTICFELRGRYHCHVSGTSTGFCNDWGDNFGNATEWGNLQSEDGRFLKQYLIKRTLSQPRRPVNVSGHSQGGADAAQIAGLLQQGDQLNLLQPAAASLYMKDDFHRAIKRGAMINIAWTEGDEASISIRALNQLAKLPLIQLQKNVSREAEQCGVRLHNAPNARHVFHQAMGVPAGYTVNPAMDASIISNPGSPCLEVGNIKLDCPAKVPWTCPAWSP
jgi:hypothetical protein